MLQYSTELGSPVQSRVPVISTVLVLAHAFHHRSMYARTERIWAGEIMTSSYNVCKYSPTGDGTERYVNIANLPYIAIHRTGVSVPS